jgi:hypothetical protein
MNQDDNKFRKVEWSGDQYSPADDDLDELPAPPARSLPPDDLALLKLAALAIGCVRFEEVEGEEYVNLHFADGSAAWSWNPLVFSGDALELAVKMRMNLWIYHDGTEANTDAGPETHNEANSGDPTAAARRAITRAAAEVGKAKFS